jgi:hypothetical protein
MKEKKFKEIVSEGISDLFYIWWQELKAVVKDQGVLIFFILVPLGYPLLYTFIYTVNFPTPSFRMIWSATKEFNSSMATFLFRPVR